MNVFNFNMVDVFFFSIRLRRKRQVHTERWCQTGEERISAPYSYWMTVRRDLITCEQNNICVLFTGCKFSIHDIARRFFRLLSCSASSAFSSPSLILHSVFIEYQKQYKRSLKA